jgi:hypothetical protein
MIDASQRMLTINSQGGVEAKDRGGMNPVMKRHLELEIKTLLQNAPRDPDKLERLLKVKERQKDEAMHMEDTQKRLVTEERLKMLKVVLYLVSRDKRKK